MEITEKRAESVKDVDCLPLPCKIISDCHDIFYEELPADLSFACGMAFEINLNPEGTPPVRQIIRLAASEAEQLKTQLRKPAG